MFGDSSFKQASPLDCMIELKWEGYLAESATVLGISNYQESSVKVTMVDLKTRKKHIMKTITTF